MIERLFTKTRTEKHRLWVDLKCGHRQYALPSGVNWEGVVCLTCGAITKIVSMQGPESLAELFRIG